MTGRLASEIELEKLKAAARESGRQMETRKPSEPLILDDSILELGREYVMALARERGVLKEEPK